MRGTVPTLNELPRPERATAFRLPFWYKALSNRSESRLDEMIEKLKAAGRCVVRQHAEAHGYRRHQDSADQAIFNGSNRSAIGFRSQRGHKISIPLFSMFRMDLAMPWLMIAAPCCGLARMKSWQSSTPASILTTSSRRFSTVETSV
jgi:hypothetical protein